MTAKFSFLLVLAMAGVFLLLPLAAQSQEMTETPMGHDQPSEIAPDVSRLVADVRHATAGFRDFNRVEDAGYGKFLDCFVNNEVGGMGQHYVNGDLLGDAVLDPMTPEALVYEPTEDGDMILVAFEYLVFADQWDAENTGRPAPVLFDRPLHLLTNIPNTPPVWALHIWLWTDNPNGLFADFNPIAFCPANQPVTDMTDRY
jgi:hypothetical protein